MLNQDLSLPDDLYSEVAEILTSARKNVRTAVNTAMVVSYWHIGRLIVEEEQNGEGRAEYGKALISELSKRLSKDFGRGFSEVNIRHFRHFYLEFSIQHSLSAESARLSQKQHAASADSSNSLGISNQKNYQGGSGDCNDLHLILRSELSWTHYRHLLKVKDQKARDWYMHEAANENWSTRALERQINAFHYERLLSSREKEPVQQEAHEKTQALRPQDILRDPYVLEFLQLKERSSYSENDLETALIDQLQNFLLELGKGFSFVSRQKRLTLDGEHFKIDLVFYNYLLKCFVLIDLKLGKLTHQDIGQIDSYVRLYEEKYRGPDDNPTIGLVLCSEKNEAVARYSVLADHQNLFASKYQLILPTEDELAQELAKELRHIERDMD